MMTILLAVVGVVLMSSDRNLKFFVWFLPILLGTFVLVECIYPGIRQEDGRMAYKFMLVFDMEFWVSSTAILYLAGKVKNLYDINRNVIVTFSEELHAKNDELQVLTEELRAQGEELQSQNDQILSQNEILAVAMDDLNFKQKQLEQLNIDLVHKNNKLLEYANELHHQRMEMELQHQQISNQYELLGETMLDLSKKQEELENLNNHLEKIVSKRTESLKEKNVKLASYAFFNSHILRAPVCRIQGLINLIQTDDNITTNNNKVYHELLDESVKELGFITSKTSKLLDTYEEVSQKEIDLLFDEVFEGKKHVF
jgi:chromosome segregation ATPase